MRRPRTDIWVECHLERADLLRLLGDPAHAVVFLDGLRQYRRRASRQLRAAGPAPRGFDKQEHWETALEGELAGEEARQLKAAAQRRESW